MKSVALHHFPQVVVESDRFRLFNPILRKRYKNRPEERIRLKWIEYLLLQTDWKRSRVGFESPVKLRQRKNTLRADLVLYSDSMKPTILIECKSESVKLNELVAEQAARYNSEVNANHLVLTNGIEDYWFEKRDNNIQPSENIFEKETSLEDLKRDLEYWSQRGFCSSNGDLEMKSWISQALDTFWTEEDDLKWQYLDFQQSVLPVPMNQFYKICNIDSERRLAVGFIGAGESNNYLVGILNSKGTNQGVISINLNKMQQGDTDSVTVFKEVQSEVMSSQKNFSIRLSEFDSDQIKNLPQKLINYFD